ncbi:hypothetical protein COCSUDRAFT_41852 [Coccomyxa subellipsoidea C-169]|uniref:Uncharacterized protein n=1 Tax=Coccomyxa subellipsoidea (strain C-169) TaxID=574566 RepID=I0YZ63_COCSC|nr:hypothetical protein COCSUDRAFT_41852 [Coccomyxa subellipsoidea C-169]EIE23682.1 hypothetical protein COCSUDRAFT_41852 [Coccomyxa subellipsoidea C-169]|eukprot:XP_005648226.1 hypothetical protein COCSUDRAFT_41852 [Coccomyxa subellipsoidea C-169]
MRWLTAVAILAMFGSSLAVKDVPIIREVNNVVGSIVALENSILAPLAPFGRKLQSFIPAVPNPDPNVIKANAIGSIFYVAGGLYNPELYKSAVTGVQPAGRKLLTNLPTLPTTTAKGPDGFPDPYGFIPAANMVASALKGKFPHRKLSSANEGLSSDAAAVHSALGFNRRA